MARKKVSVMLSLCILGVLAISACGGDEKSSTPSAPSSTPASTSPEKTRAAKAAADAKAMGKNESKTQAKREQDHKEESADPDSAPSGSSMGSKESGAKPSAHLSDEDRCAKKPSTCGPGENVAPDYSNPDVRRAEERAKEPDELPECHSTDCEELRRGER